MFVILELTERDMKEHLLPASGFKAVLQLRTGNKAYVFISTFKRTYLLFISRHQQMRDDSSLLPLLLPPLTCAFSLSL